MRKTAATEVPHVPTTRFWSAIRWQRRASEGASIVEAPANCSVGEASGQEERVAEWTWHEGGSRGEARGEPSTGVGRSRQPAVAAAWAPRLVVPPRPTTTRGRRRLPSRGLARAAGCSRSPGDCRTHWQCASCVLCTNKLRRDRWRVRGDPQISYRQFFWACGRRCSQLPDTREARHVPLSSIVKWVLWSTTPVVASARLVPGVPIVLRRVRLHVRVGAVGRRHDGEVHGLS